MAFPDTHIVVCTMYVVLNGLDAKMNLVMYADVIGAHFFPHSDFNVHLNALC